MRKNFLFALAFVSVVALSLLLAVNVSYADGDASPLPESTPSPAFSAPSETASAEPSAPSPPVPTPFSFVWLGDTQTAAWNESMALYSMGCWIADNREKENIVHVVQTGDMVENGFKQPEWDAFYSCYDRFAGVIPYITVNGNHDIGVKLQDPSVYTCQRFLDEIPKEQQFQDGRAVYELFSAGGTDFIILGIGYGAEVLANRWARETLQSYPDRVAILLFHDYLHPRYGLYYTGQFLYHRVVARCPNVKLVLCGHYRGTSFRTDEFDDSGDGVPDRTVHTMLFNFQGYKRYNAQMRLLTFHPEDRSITVNTFNTMIDRTYKDDTLKQNPFTIENAY